MKIAENVYMLEIKAEMGIIHPVLIQDDKDLVLIDTGMPMQTDLLAEAVKEAGLRTQDITVAILTHQDLDHVGGAKTLAGLGARIYAHEIESAYIQGDKTSIRLTDMESRFNELSEGERAFYERAKAGAPYFYVPVDKKLKDGEILDICGGIEVIHTPGHTPGHIALLLKQSNILAAGDAANIYNNKLVGADPNSSRNTAEAQTSFEKILSCKPTSVVCYHGGIIEVA